MVQQSATQGTPPPVPAIPKMEAGTPGTLTPREARELTKQGMKELRDQIRAAVREGTQGGVVVAGTQAPVPPAGTPQTTTSTAPPDDFRFPDVPPNAYIISMVFFVTVATVVIGVPIVRAIARRMDRRTDAIRSGTADVGPQIRQLQESVDAMAIELERISEAQRFSAKLLSERADAALHVEGKAR
ncbi:MAG: hypothetical protein ACHQQ3_10895 [Gemmatimonadales bacterium]